jgi:hypothetical protein
MLTYPLAHLPRLMQAGVETADCELIDIGIVATRRSGLTRFLLDAISPIQYDRARYPLLK